MEKEEFRKVPAPAWMDARVDTVHGFEFVFVKGHYDVTEARALRDWLNAVLPD